MAPLIMCLVFSAAFSPEAITLVERSGGLETPEKGSGRTEYEIGDINADGHPDIVSLGDHGNPGSGQKGIMVWLGDGQGNWSQVQDGWFGYGGCALGDINGNGVMDIAWGMHHDYGSGGFGDRLISAALGNGSGTGWIPWDEGLAESGETWGMFATDLADFDNDGRLDIICQSFGASNGVRVYRNNGDGTWEQKWQLTGENANYTVETGDFNADGSMDFICTRWGSGIYTNVFFGNGQYGFIMKQDSIPGKAVNAVDTGDFNNDGADDILVSFASDSGARVYSFNTSTESWEDCSSGLPGGSSYSMVQFGHLNGDEYLDVIVYSKPQGTVYLGDGQGNWTSDAVFSFSTPGYDSALRSGGDIDHDGRHDIVVQAAEGTIYTYTNTLRALSPWQQPAELTARLVSPRGGETFPAGSVRFISWLTAIPPAAGQAQVKIELSQTGPSGPWITIAEAAPDNGRFQWTVSQVNSSQCRLRITATAGAQTHQHMSLENFTIVQLTGTAENHAAPVPGLNLAVHPNPASGAVTLTVPGEEVFPGEITVMDITGRTVEKLTVGSYPAVIGESLPPGIYTVLLECSRGTAGARFVKL